MDVSSVTSLVVSVISVSIAVAAFVLARRDPRPKIRGRLNAVLHAPLELSGGRQITAIMVHVTLSNSTKHEAHIVGYDLSVNRGDGDEPLTRLKNMRQLPSLGVGDTRITLNEDILIYRPPRPVEYGTPLNGIVVFYIEEPDVLEEAILRYSLSVTDIFGRVHEIGDYNLPTSRGGFDVVELFEMAGAKIEYAVDEDNPTTHS